MHEDLSGLPQQDFENYIMWFQIVTSEWIDDPEHHYTFVFNLHEQKDRAFVATQTIRLVL